ncbi:MAG: hypothetical protein QNJ65_04945 [Xenococcaceae cyanobacterium MO_234.B1]|nr:hypothetical protein [Xenococcaceae cyanobacterium MO_234.B1]
MFRNYTIEERSQGTVNDYGNAYATDCECLLKSDRTDPVNDYGDGYALVFWNYLGAIAR